MKANKLITYSLIVSFLFLMFNGLTDLLYGIKQQYVRTALEKHLLQLLPSDVNGGEYLHHIQDSMLIKFRNIPLVGRIPKQGLYGMYAIGKDGNRLYSEQEPTQSIPKKRILILGSSQSFGYLSDAEHDVIGQLSKLLPQYQIENFSVPGQTLRENLSLFKYLVSVGKKYDYVYIVNGPMDIYAACVNAGISEPPSPAISFDIGITKLINKTIKVLGYLAHSDANAIEMQVNMCNDKPFNHLVVDDMMIYLHQILDYGNNQEKIKTVVIVPPSPYTLSDQLNTNNLSQDQTFVALKPVFGKLMEEFLMRADSIPNVYNLTRSFDNVHSQLFIDTGAHLTAQGNKILAHEIQKIIENNAE